MSQLKLVSLDSQWPSTLPITGSGPISRWIDLVRIYVGLQPLHPRSYPH